MATKVVMPTLGLTMTEGTIEEWKANEGDKVNKGDVLFSVSTDKLTNDIEAEESGTLLKVVHPAGSVVECKKTIAWIGEEGEAIPEDDGDEAPAEEAAPQEAPAASALATASEPAADGKKSVVVIGAGPGGYVAAIRAAQLGAEVTVVEQEYLGGTCLNVGCIPTKSILHSAELYEQVKSQAANIGVDVEGVSVNFGQVMKHKSEVSAQLVGGIGGLFAANKITKIDGSAAFTGEKQLEVTKADGSKETLTPDAIIVASGSVNATPPIPGVGKDENPACIGSTEALELEEIPKSMVVIGGGVIGLELACAYATFGTKVQVVEALDKMLPILDQDIVAVGVSHLENMGVGFHLSCTVQEVEKTAVGGKVKCVDKDGNNLEFEAEKVLVAVGRRSNTEALNLDAAGIKNDRGRILVNDKMQTNVPGVYAIGDCVFGKAMLAHTASAMGEVAAENIMGIAAEYDQSTCPSCVYMEPEAASVGMTEDEAKAKGLDYKVGKFPMMANGKAIIANGGEGLVKIIADSKYGQVLGVHIAGPRATDLIAEGALAIKVEATLDELIETIHSHPTISETMREAALDAEGRVIHMPPR